MSTTETKTNTIQLLDPSQLCSCYMKTKAGHLRGRQGELPPRVVLPGRVERALQDALVEVRRLLALRRAEILHL